MEDGYPVLEFSIFLILGTKATGVFHLFSAIKQFWDCL